MASRSYWMDIPVIAGRSEFPEKASVVVVGSGLSGVSVGMFLREKGFEDVLMIDHDPGVSASYRNCGHILYGTVESMKAMSEIHGFAKARELWGYSIEICHMVRDTIRELKINADYKQDGYLVIAASEVEDGECRDSIELLRSGGFHSEYVDARTVRELGFKNCFGARYESGSAQAHPVKFRNGLVEHFLKLGGRYHSGLEAVSVEETSEGARVVTRQGVIECDAVVIAANAYSPLFSDFFRAHGLIDPFRGQILTSKPLKEKFRVRYPHSFDHGYEYALVTPDNRLMLGGWRQNSETREMGTYSLNTNPLIEEGLRQFARDHYAIDDELAWEYSWSGIMAASRTGLPFIGNTTSPRIYSCAGYTGHGFSWAHGSAYLLAQIMAGETLPGVAKYFNPKTAI